MDADEWLRFCEWLRCMPCRLPEATVPNAQEEMKAMKGKKATARKAQKEMNATKKKATVRKAQKASARKARKAMKA
jgi:hypothetical protein